MPVERKDFIPEGYDNWGDFQISMSQTTFEGWHKWGGPIINDCVFIWPKDGGVIVLFADGTWDYDCAPFAD